MTSGKHGIMAWGAAGAALFCGTLWTAEVKGEQSLKVGEPLSRVEELFGEPNARAEVDGLTFYNYPGGLIEIKNGKVHAVKGAPRPGDQGGPEAPDAFKFLIKRATDGDLKAQKELSGNYLFGKGVRMDPGEAVRWLRMAAEQGDGRAQYEMGYLLQAQLTIPRNHRESIKWYRKAADQGIFWALNNMAMIQAISDDPEVWDGNLAVEYALKAIAANAGDFKHWVTASQAYARKGDFDKALQHLDKARKVYKSRFRLPSHAEMTRKFEEYQQLFENKLPILGDWTKPNVVQESDLRAVRAAADRNDPLALFILAYYQQKRTLPAENIMLKSAEHGNAWAQAMLGQSLIYGEGAAVNIPEGIKWARLSAGQSNPVGLNVLATCAYLGMGMERDLNEAEALWKRAAEQDLALAQHGLGRLYLEDRSDEEQAEQWLLKAAYQNMPNALGSLAQVYASATNPRLRNPRKAFEWALRATILEPLEWRHYESLGLAYGAGGKYLKGIAAFEDATRLANAFVASPDPSHKTRRLTAQAYKKAQFRILQHKDAETLIAEHPFWLDPTLGIVKTELALNEEIKTRIRNRMEEEPGASSDEVVKDVMEAILKSPSVGSMADLSAAFKPIHEAVIAGDPDALKKLLDQGADIHQATEQGLSPLLVAVMTDQQKVAELLLKSGARVDQPMRTASPGMNGCTPLHLAAMLGNRAMAGLLLKHRADINKETPLGDTPIDFAVSAGYPETVRLLLDAGADVKNKRADSRTPLHKVRSENILVSAIKKLFPTGIAHKEKQDVKKVIQLLLDRGAQMDARDRNGMTPLNSAAMNGDLAVVKALLYWGADVNKKDQKGYSPILSASDYGHVDVVEALLEDGAKLEDKTHEFMTPLLLAANARKHELVEFLIKQGASVHRRERHDATALHFAALLGSEETVDLLLKAGADVNARDEKDRTPLHYAAMQKKPKAVKLLIESGADTEARDIDGKSARDYLGWIKERLPAGKASKQTL